jgi:class 3 adenylate cyclase
MAEGLQRREFIEKTFSRYVDEKIAKRILGGSQDEINIAGQKMNATVLFSDIRGFTTLSEQLPPEEVVQVLNTYFSKMVATVKSHGGVIDKFIGDAMLCVWGVPHPVENGTLQAVRCALEMQKEMKVLNEEFSARGLPSLGVGIGINVGSVVAGSLGSSDRMEYTVIGDVVNTAQRVESKAPAGSVLLTDPTYQTFREAIEAESMGEFSLKGKAVPMTLWSVKRVKEKTEPLAA